MNSRQCNTIIAALRYWQYAREAIIIDERINNILNIETNDGETEPLSNEEIDSLIEDINFGGYRY